MRVRCLVAMLALSCGPVVVVDGDEPDGPDAPTIPGTTVGPSTGITASTDVASSTGTGAQGLGGEGGVGASVGTGGFGLGGSGASGGSTSTGAICETEAEALAAFGGCMTFDDWIASGASSIANAQTVSGSCSTCHSSGAGGVLLSGNSNQTFAGFTASPMIELLAEPVLDANGCVVDIEYSAGLLMPPADHPPYMLSSGVTEGLLSFFTLTYDGWSQGPCP